MARSSESRRRLVSRREKPPPGMSLIGRKPNKSEVMIGICALIALYLATGQHARFVCHLCTCVPAAIHNLKMIRVNMTVEQVNFTLLYWVVQGVLAVADTLLNEIAGYYVLKFALLTMMLVHAYRMDSEEYEPISELSHGEVRVKRPRRPLSSETFVNKTSKTTQTNDFTESSELASTSSDTPRRNSRSPTGNVTTGINCSTALPVTTSGVAKCTSNPSFSDLDLTMTLCGSMKSPTSKKPPTNHLITTPGDTLTFAWPNRQQAVLYVSNNSGRRVMWAIKTNSRKRIGASPSFGILPVGGAVQIKVAVDLTDSSTISKEDRISIDYMFIDEINPNVLEFDQKLFLDDNITRERKSFTICYD
uniref:Major sperm protein n=1 Tax=Steinernema glaseri TaxID=37863 RepID=A0A1I7Z5W9_9BILA